MNLTVPLCSKFRLNLRLGPVCQSGEMPNPSYWDGDDIFLRFPMNSGDLTQFFHLAVLGLNRFSLWQVAATL